jgi:hypothetical protein
MCCAALLRRKRWNVTLCLLPKNQSPTLVLNAVTVQMLHDIFGAVKPVFRDAQPLNRHYINWGDNLPDEVTPSSGLTLNGDALSERLLELLRQDPEVVVSDDTNDERGQESFDWYVYAINGQLVVNKNSPAIPARRFGERHAISVDVTLHHHADCTASMIESTPGGWLFLAPLAQDRAVLQAIVPERPKEALPTICALLDRTKEIKRIVKEVAGGTNVVKCAPKKLSEMNGADWIATGTAASSYDPLCGDGSGYAIRTAILAAAVLEGIRRGTASESLLAYYKLRLTYAFYTHLRSCLSFYSAARFDDSWRAELIMMETGVREVEQELSTMSAHQYRLDGFELLPVCA